MYYDDNLLIVVTCSYDKMKPITNDLISGNFSSLYVGIKDAMLRNINWHAIMER